MSATGKNAFEKAIVKTMKMDETTWLRHASPWSVWTRFSCLPLIVMAIWSRQWLDWWALAPLTVALLWTWLNPRVFSPPPRPQQLGIKGNARRTGLAQPCSGTHSHPSRKNGRDHQHSHFPKHRHYGLRFIRFRHLANSTWRCVGHIGEGMVLRPHGLAL